MSSRIQEGLPTVVWTKTSSSLTERTETYLQPQFRKLNTKRTIGTSALKALEFWLGTIRHAKSQGGKPSTQNGLQGLSLQEYECGLRSLGI